MREWESITSKILKLGIKFLSLFVFYELVRDYCQQSVAWNASCCPILQHRVSVRRAYVIAIPTLVFPHCALMHAGMFVVRNTQGNDSTRKQQLECLKDDHAEDH